MPDLFATNTAEAIFSLDSKNTEQDGRLGIIELEKTRFIADYVPGQAVSQSNMVLNQGWLMHANKDTSEPAAPQPIGSPTFLYAGSNPTDTITAKQLNVGQRYTWGTSGYASAVRIYTVTGNFYRIFAISDPDGDAIIVELLPAFTADTTGQVQFEIKQTALAAGTVFDLILAMEEPAATPTTVEGNWNYQTPNNAAVPTSGQISHATKALDELRVHKTDNDSGDRSAELAGITVGDVVNGPGGIRWAIQAISDMGAWINFTVAPAQQGAPAGVFLFVFETVVATPITVVIDTDYWTLNPLPNGTVQGRYQIDGGAWVTTDEQYSIDMEVQEAYVSPDWDFMALTE